MVKENQNAFTRLSMKLYRVFSCHLIKEFITPSIFVLQNVNICPIPELYLHHTCIVCAPSMNYICTIHVLYMFHPCIISILFMYYIRAIHVLYMFHPCITYVDTHVIYMPYSRHYVYATNVGYVHIIGIFAGVEYS